MVRPWSLRLRLLAGTLLWIVAALVATGVVLAMLFERHAGAQFEAQLRVHLNQLAANLEIGPDGKLLLAVPMSDPRMDKPLSGLYWQVRQGTDSVLRSRSLWDTVLALPPAPPDGAVGSLRLAGPGGRELFALAQQIRLADTPDRPLALVVAADSADLRVSVREFVRAMVVALAVLAGGLVAAAVVQVRMGLAPLQRLAVAITRLRGGASTRLEGRYPAEVQPLVDDFNAVIERNASIVARARTQAGNLAHAVRTPLTVLANAATEAGRWLSDGAPPAAAALAALVREQVAQARRQVDWHLSHARAAAASDVPGQRTLIAPLVEALVRVMRRVHADRELRFDLGGVAPGLAFAGEEQDLQEMLGNLIDNACKWAAGNIRVSAREHVGRVEISVDDDGPGLPAQSREAVLERGVRADERMPGSGLGLAIAGDLARLYGGSLRLDVAPGGGLRAVVALPRA